MAHVLEFIRDTEDTLGPTWVMTGYLGDVTFGPMGIDLHATFPLNDDEPSRVPCDRHAQCWRDGSSLEGANLRKSWEQAGFDDGVIRAELFRWYVEVLQRASMRADDAEFLARRGGAW